MAMNIESIERGLTRQNNHNKECAGSSDIISPSVVKLVLLLVSCTCGFVGMIGGPLLLRLYFLHGGSGKWLSSWAQMTGFPILFIPLVILYSRRDRSTEFFASKKLSLHAALTGLVQGIGNFMFCFGLSFLPASTVSLLVTTQLIFTSFISLIWVKQKFTPYSLNAIVLIIMGSILIALSRSSDRPPGVTNSQYVFGFSTSIASAAIFGFVIVSTQVAYARAKQAMTYSIVLQFQVCVAFFATLTCALGSLINQDFTAMHKEAREFGLGAKMYYLVLVSNMVVWQMMFIGRAGIIFCTSSLFAGVMSAIFSTLSQIAAVIAFHENFTGEKGMALALTLWGFTSYFYGSYKKTKKPKPVTL
ncbi:purine permease 3-like [Papaver somniferum]|uniref:purine permease 3-like n=1 Tax=Papaver somniferum TaxID=3469 RepID=UPI000E705E21|nr:purine permease 3-like [Papaver somniferum]